MKIMYDYQILISQRYGGISRYFYELIKNLDKMDNVDTELPVSFNRNVYFEEYFGKKSKDKYLPKTGRLIVYYNQQRAKSELRKTDIFHPTYYHPYALRAVNKLNTKLVITVYDMIHEMFPQYFPDSDNVIKYKKKSMEIADAIIAISNSTKNDILRIHPHIDSDKITVIHLGTIFEKQLVKIELPSKYLLFVGERGGYKNFDAFIRAFAFVARKDNELTLLCIGKPFEESEIASLKQLDVYEKTSCRRISDKEFYTVYNKAHCFVFPSLYEGFGIPVLESMYCGCPALLANCSSLPEVGGDAALYFNPSDPNQIAECIRAVDTHREKLVKKGYERAKLFSWENMAKQTHEIYKKLLSKA